MELKLGWRWKAEPDKRELRRQARRHPPMPTGLPKDGFCDQCGVRADGGDHATCERRRELEPPRFCQDCGRRMVVQVVPSGWTANCSRHGERHSEDAETGQADDLADTDEAGDEQPDAEQSDAEQSNPEPG
jgi:hypothetical protein